MTVYLRRISTVHCNRNVGFLEHPLLGIEFDHAAVGFFSKTVGHSFELIVCFLTLVERDNLGVYQRNLMSEGERKSLINKGFIPLLIRRSLVRAQVEEPLQALQALKSPLLNR